MSEALFRLIVGIVAGVAGIAEVVLMYAKPKQYEKICASLPIVVGAVTEVLTLFATV